MLSRISTSDSRRSRGSWERLLVDQLPCARKRRRSGRRRIQSGWNDRHWRLGRDQRRVRNRGRARTRRNDRQRRGEWTRNGRCERDGGIERNGRVRRLWRRERQRRPCGLGRCRDWRGLDGHRWRHRRIERRLRRVAERRVRKGANPPERDHHAHQQWLPAKLHSPRAERL